MDATGSAAFLSRCFSFWPQLSEAERENFCRRAQPVRYAAGTSIHSGSSDCIGVLAVKSGQLRVYLLSEEGRDITLYRLFPGDVCILSASCVLDAITFDVYIDAEEDTELLVVDSSYFHALADQNVYVRCFGYQLATERFSDVMWAMQQILFMGADQRLAIFLQQEMQQEGTDTLHLTHERIARYMGTAREVVTRMLNYFAGEGIVSLSRGGIRILDAARLARLAAQEPHRR